MVQSHHMPCLTFFSHDPPPLQLMKKKYAGMLHSSTGYMFLRRSILKEGL